MGRVYEWARVLPKWRPKWRVPSGRESPVISVNSVNSGARGDGASRPRVPVAGASRQGARRSSTKLDSPQFWVIPAFSVKSLGGESGCQRTGHVVGTYKMTRFWAFRPWERPNLGPCYRCFEAVGSYCRQNRASLHFRPRILGRTGNLPCRGCILLELETGAFRMQIAAPFSACSLTCIR